MSPPLLHLRDIHLTFGGTPLLEGAELAVAAGERICLIGRNGSGKSTLLRIAAGIIEADAGERFVQPGATMRYLPQEPDLSGFDTVLAFAEAGLAPGDAQHRAQLLLEQLGLTGDEDPAHLSGGEARRAALAQALAPEPDILLLDEPTNHLDLPAIEWLEAELAAFRGALVLISHDRRFLQRLARSTVWLSLGVAHRIERDLAGFEAWRDEHLEASAEAARKADRKLAAETEWLHKGVTARRKRNQGRLRALMQLRQERRERRQPTGTAAKLVQSEAELSGRLVIEAQDIAKTFDGATVVKDFSTRILRGDRLGIVGPNGAGKTTLLNMLTGVLAPDSGKVRLGTNLEMVTLDQRRESLDPAWTLSQVLTGGSGDMVTVAGQKRHVIGYMKDFLFLPEQARTPVGVLSGGERARLMLARALARPSNLLVLDEPTNDLDLETLDLLQELLVDYAGTVILVSHDRDFLDRTVTATIAWEGPGRWTEYAGGYSDMLAQKGPAAAPGRGSAGKTRPKEKGGASPDRRKEGSGGSASRQGLSFTEQHEVKDLQKRMEKLQAEIAKQKAVLDDASLYHRDPDGFARAAKALETAETALATAEDRWLELELKREAAAEGSA
ncbi:ABC-F family ATP-binding cassette domain-containing protein [Marinibaculum pumilum]|uniref:ATP-binding protein Uup n=1 Tax=Marinibaculum pumilum TaxID=1766165 RepID=A0ABV7LA29_9PROT